MADFNTTAKCTGETCNWVVTYDKNDDWRHVGELVKCPKCGKPIKRIPYKPIY